MKKLILIITLIVIFLVAYWLISPLWRSVVVNDNVPVETKNTSVTINETIMLNGNFVNKAHQVTGQAKVIDTQNGKVLRFENFETV